jgi:hypothetical protein
VRLSSTSECEKISKAMRTARWRATQGPLQRLEQEICGESVGTASWPRKSSVDVPHAPYSYLLFPSGLRKQEIRNARNEDFSDLDRAGFEVGDRTQPRDDGDDVVTCSAPRVIEVTQHFDGSRIDSNFLVGFTNRCGLPRLAFLKKSPRKRDLACVARGFFGPSN